MDIKKHIKDANASTDDVVYDLNITELKNTMKKIFPHIVLEYSIKDSKFIKQKIIELHFKLEEHNTHLFIQLGKRVLSKLDNGGLLCYLLCSLVLSENSIVRKRVREAIAHFSTLHQDKYSRLGMLTNKERYTKMTRHLISSKQAYALRTDEILLFPYQIHQTLEEHKI